MVIEEDTDDDNDDDDDDEDDNSNDDDEDDDDNNNNVLGFVNSARLTGGWTANNTRTLILIKELESIKFR